MQILLTIYLIGLMLHVSWGYDKLRNNEYDHNDKAFEISILAIFVVLYPACYLINIIILIYKYYKQKNG